jgi:2'-5' RNA ligase
VQTIGVAIEVPDPWGADLQETRAGYGDLQAWTIPTHITLLPPTQVPTDRMTAVDDHLRGVAAVQSPFRIELAGADSFRPVTPTAYLRLGVGASECVQLERQIRTSALRRKLMFDYHPHVTLAFDVADDVLDRVLADFADYSLTFDVQQFSRFAISEDGIWLPECDFAMTGPAP